MACDARVRKSKVVAGGEIKSSLNKYIKKMRRREMTTGGYQCRSETHKLVIH